MASLHGALQYPGESIVQVFRAFVPAMVITRSCIPIEYVLQIVAATSKHYLLRPAAQTDLPGAECRPFIPSDDLRPMREKRDELKTRLLWEPRIRLVGASLKLSDDVHSIEAAALQLDRDHPTPRALLPEKQVIAAFSITRNVQSFGVEIDDGFPVRYRSDGD